MRDRVRRGADDDDEDDDDDKEYVVSGEELKKLVRLGRKRPMPFAFCPSAGEDESLFATHRKKSAKKIGKATKEDSGQTKVAWGTFVIVDRVMILTCQRELPSIAKKLKKHMRAERLPLNIRVLDASGKEVESDIEDLSAELDPFADEDMPDSGGDRFRSRLAELGEIVLAMPGEAGDAARDLLAGALRALDNGSRDKAQKMAALLETEVRRVTNSGRRPTVRKKTEPKPETTPEEIVQPEPPKKAEVVEAPPPEDKRETMRQARRIASLRPRVKVLEEPAAAKLTAALALVAKQLRGGQAEGAGDAIDRIEAALERVEARAAG